MNHSKLRTWNRDLLEHRLEQAIRLMLGFNAVKCQAMGWKTPGRVWFFSHDTYKANIAPRFLCKSVAIIRTYLEIERRTMCERRLPNLS